jgi:hypothetical protein
VLRRSIQGGTHATAVKGKKRHGLVNLLRQDALCVQANCNDDLETLLSSGFLAANNSRVSAPLPKPVITAVTQGNTGQLIVKSKAIRNAKTYDVRVVPIGADGKPGTPQMLTGLTNSRAMAVNGPSFGTTYSFQVRVCGTAGYSDWSDAVNHVCL